MQNMRHHSPKNSGTHVLVTWHLLIPYSLRFRFYWVRKESLKASNSPRSVFASRHHRILPQLPTGMLSHIFVGILKSEIATYMHLFFFFYQAERQLAAATIANHASSLIYPSKFLHREWSPDYRGVKVIKQLRSQVAYFQRKARAERPSTKEELEAQNKWLNW